MANGFGQVMRAHLLNWLCGKGSPTTPAGVIYLSLHTADPGPNGQTSNEATGTSYAAQATDADDWASATDATPTVMTTVNPVVFGPAGAGGWSSGADFTHVAAWRHVTNRTAADFVGRGQLAVAKPVLEGDPLTIAAGSFSFSLAETADV